MGRRVHIGHTLSGVRVQRVQKVQRVQRVSKGGGIALTVHSEHILKER